MKRRGLLLGLGALFAAPAIVRANALMPVSVLKPELLISGFNINDPDSMFIMVGRQRMIWSGQNWIKWSAVGDRLSWSDVSDDVLLSGPPRPDAVHWSEALSQPVKFDGYVVRVNGGTVPEVAQDAIQKVLDRLARVSDEARLARILSPIKG